MNTNTKAVALGTALVTFATATLPLVAQSAEEDSAPVIEEVVVVAHPLSGEGLSQATDVLSGEELKRKLDTNIASTLGNQPGIRNASFGKVVGRPVIHGLGGPRVRVMEDRIDTLDVSVTSADHVVAIEPFIAERIEVLKGPSALLYGTGAIGGVVDIHTNRIPHSVPDKPLTGGIETRFDSNTDGNATSGKFNGGGGNFAWHLDGTFKDGDNYEIPGFVQSEGLRALAAADPDAEEPISDILPGSFFDSENYAGGASYIADWGFFGASISRLEADYGLPGGGEAEEEGEEGEEEEEEGFDEDGFPLTPTLEVEQTRVDVELGVSNPFGAFDSLNIRFGINDYEHQEIEPNGEVATNFSNEAWEARGELTFKTDSLSGAIGAQHTDREFSAIGEEAFVPPVDSTDSGLFVVVERPFQGFDLEAGARIGLVTHEPTAAGSNQDEFTVWAVSLGAVVPVSDGLRFGINADYSSRAPIPEELFSNGPHLATQAFEIGDPDLDEEQAFNISAQLNFDSEWWSASATIYYNDFNDFIFEQGTGEIEDGLPVFEFQQEDAQFFGADVEASVNFARWDNGEAKLRALFDFVDAELSVTGNDNLPRIPPLRYGAGLEVRYGVFSASVDYTRVTQQDDIAEQEFVTDAFNDWRAYVGADFQLDGATLAVFVHGKNLSDEEQRKHASFISNFAPAPGRTIEAGLRVEF